MSKKYVFTYFDGKARAEPIRLAFAATGTEYEDVRLTMEEWHAKKDGMNTPYGQIPILTIDGKETLCQSFAILKYIGRDHGLCGEGAMGQAKVDMMMGCLNDTFTGLASIMFREPDAEKKAEKLKEFGEKTLPTALERLEKLATEKFLVDEKMSVADFVLHVFQGWVAKFGVDWTKYPKLDASIENTSANPGIAAWLEKRPVTDL